MTYTDDQIEKMLKKVYEQSIGRWRTVGGLSRATGIPEDVIRDFIQRHSHNFREPRADIPIPAGDTGSFSYKPAERFNRIKY